ncbi:MAG: PAS domain S-box protein [Candidatus Marinimicrobia bacterium]|nr:PAS domain S-box protein [Candidatus Neomarinimicrobiota bacterium]
MKKKTGTPSDTTELHRAPRSLWRISLIVTAYLFAFIILDFFTQTFEELPGIVAWYPPAGLGFALLLVFGARFAPALGISSLLSSFFIYHIPQPPETLFLWAFFISLIYGVAIAFLRHRTRFNWQLQKSRDVVFLIFTTVLVSTILAVLSISGSTLSGEMPRNEVLSMIFHWWIGETVGVLTVTPFLLIYVMPGLKRFVEGQPVRLSEHRSFPHQTLSVIGQAFSLVFVLYWVFGAHILDEFQPLYLIFLPLIWIALQRGFRGITVGIVALNFGVITALWLFRFDFARLSELQLLMIVNCIVGLLMGAVVTERKSSEKDLQQITKDWEETFDILNESISIHDMDFNITRSNKAGERLLGKNAQEILSAKCFASYHGKNCPPAGCPGCESLKTGKFSAFEIFEPHLNKFIEVKALPRFDEKNNIVGLVHIVRDITKHKRAEEALRESEEKYRLIVENAHDGIEITQHDRIMFANAQFAEMLGYTPTEIIDLNFLKIYSEQGLKDLYERKKNREAGKPELYRYETIFLKKDGTVIDVEVRYRIIDYNGEAATFAIIQDITKRKQAENTIAVSEIRYRRLFEAARDGILILDAETGIIDDVNPFLVEMLGISREAICGKMLWDLGFFKDIVSNKTNLMELQEKKYIRYEDLPLKTADGRRFDVEFVSNVYLMDHRKVIQCNIRDITERKQAKEALQKSEEKFRGIFENVKDAYYETTEEGTIIEISPSIEILSKGQYHRKEVIGKSMSEFYADPERRQVFLTELKEHGAVSDFEIHLSNKDGSLIPCSITSSLHMDALSHQKKIVGSIRDISERKRAEETKKILEMQLQRGQKLESLGTLAAGIAHDFNNILAIIIGHASLIEMGEVQTTQMANSLQAIQKAGQRGTALVKQLLTFARKSEPSLQAVNINQIIEELMKLFTETFPKTIEVKTQMGKIPFLLGDAGQLHQVLLNLCVNARDAMPNGGSLTVRTGTVMGDAVRLLLPQASATEYVRIEISDTGTGISEMTIKRIFDPFFTTKEHGKGTGLGLSIVFGIVTNHNGFILVDSALGKGTAFTVYLPVPKGSESLEISIDQEIKDIAGGNETILIIEDEEMVQNFLKEVLEKKGYHVVTAVDGKAGLQKYNEQRSEIDLIISDIGLPVMNGIELFERLIVVNPQVKVIIASGYIEPEKRSDLLSRGLKSFIQKPYKPTEVWAKVREVLDKPL